MLHHLYEEIFVIFKDRYAHGMGVISEKTVFDQYWYWWISLALYLVLEVLVKSGIGTPLMIIRIRQVIFSEIVLPVLCTMPACCTHACISDLCVVSQG